ncbi:carbohydrate ABC transporter permease [Micromonospora sp. NPDC006431]|uniref:carbohydrate ABC transporter permease n=1 Tax=Micromonospora sp. NPDC006431 TaxID=3364235 RepID=UPI003679E470
MSEQNTQVQLPPGRPAPPARRELVRALPWLMPALALILTIVLFPAAYMVWTSSRDVSQAGVDRGPAGLDNFVALLNFPALGRVFTNTIIWVVGVVLVTLLISLALAQLLNQAFPGRRLVRLAVIVPWAASVVMTSTVFYYALDPFYGVFNQFLVDLGILDAGFGFTRRPVPAFVVSMVVAVFVSLPFTTYTILAGLQTVPDDIVEAARMDGAGPGRIYRRIVLPILRPAIAVAVLINIINVFNSLPILRTMTGSIPGYDADTTTTLIFKYVQQDRQVDLASALSVVNFLIVLAVIGIYLAALRPMRDE